MKKSFLIISILLLSSVFFAASLGVFGGKEISGRERFYLGASLKGDSIVGLGVDILVPIDSSEVTEGISNVNFLELDPYLYLNIDIGNILLYTGIGPISVVDISNFNFTLYSNMTLRGKIGVSINMKSVGLFLETITAFTYSPLATTGIYGIQGGIKLNF